EQKLPSPLQLTFLFCGFFIGDHRLLNILKTRLLEEFDVYDWEEIQEVWQVTQEKNFQEKLAVRFDLSPLESELALGLREFLWSLPYRETMLEACQQGLAQTESRPPSLTPLSEPKK
ncbi:hypothetical protein ACFLZP_04605, partial [Patescibacteria group bacterium]